jgi:hypothetical protein
MVMLILVYSLQACSLINAVSAAEVVMEDDAETVAEQDTKAYAKKKDSVYQIIQAQLLSQKFHPNLPDGDRHRIMFDTLEMIANVLPKGHKDIIFASRDYQRLYERAARLSEPPAFFQAEVDDDNNDIPKATVDRYAAQLLNTLDDHDCMDRDFDASSPNFNPIEASHVLKKVSCLQSIVHIPDH